MKDPHAPRTGVLECEKGSASFYVDDFSFCIMNNVMKKVTNRFGETYNAANFLFTLKKQGNFLIGSTNDGNSIAIYAKDCLDNCSTSKCMFRTSTYVIQNAISTEQHDYLFDAIELRGGTLNRLFSIKYLHVDYSDSNYIIKEDSFELQGILNWNKQRVKITIGWGTTEHNQSRKVEISTNNPYFRFEFSVPVNLDEALMHVERARELMSFLSYRDNTEFDSICFQHKSFITDEDNFKHEYYSDDAYAFINYGFSPTEKEPHECICFDDIKDSVFNLFPMFYDCSDYNPINHLGFITKSDKEANLISPFDIREIATFLECETKCVCKKRDLKSKEIYDESKRLSLLLEKIKQVISEDEISNGPLPDSIQSQLTKRFNNVSLPNKSKDIALYESYQNIVGGITPFHRKIIDPNDIKNFRDYRNKETHGNYNLLNMDIGITALHLAVTVYCSILHRSGVSDQILIELCKKRFFR